MARSAKKPTARKPSQRKRPAPKPRSARAGDRFEALIELQRRLLARDGCPWDREQTHESLRTYLIEEAYEVLDALESGSTDKFAEELGDLLLQLVFHAELAKKAGRFDISDVIEHIHTKMVRRHPHVFGDASAKTASDVLKNWEQLKAEERRANAADAASANGANSAEASEPGAPPLLGGIPRSLPAVLEAYQLTRRAARVGFDWPTAEGVLEKLREEAVEIEAELASADSRRVETEIGDLLFSAVNVARFLKVDPEIALKRANRKFLERFGAMEREAASHGQKLAELSAAQLDDLWNQAKREESAASERRARKVATR
ncbi:MAG TPA: nucleoside triphosphate pyrophosphohydrolase [Candidatus Acidoferrales bacterium]|nr:nucleoside triphosphate pyrophosphohydrolase [Candidatus Acidoferrales bacterium]